MKLTTTLNRIYKHHPCKSGWITLRKHLGDDFDYCEEINLLTILESNSVEDMLWALRATIQDPTRVAMQLAIEFSEQVLPIFENKYPNDDRPRKAIQAGKDYLSGKITLEELKEARDAAGNADADADAAPIADADAAVAAYAVYVAVGFYDVNDSADYAVNTANAAIHASYAGADSFYAKDVARKAREKQAQIIRLILSLD